MKTKERSFSIDLIRSTAVLFVVLIHLHFFPKTVNLLALPNIIYVSFLSTCIPLFVIVSGYLLIDKEDEPALFIKRVVRIIIPWISWSILFTVWQILALKLPFHSFFGVVKIFYHSLYGFWFVPAILGFYIYLPVLRMLAKKSRLGIYYLFFVWLALIVFLPSVLVVIHKDAPVSVNVSDLLATGIKFMGYAIFGYIFKIDIKNSIIYKKVGILFLVTGLILSTITTYSNFVRNQWDTTFLTDFSITTFMISIGLFTLIYFAGEKIKDKVSQKVNSVFISISELSLAIYLSQFLTISIVKSYINFDYSRSLLLQIGTGIIVFILTYIMIYFLNKIPVLKKLLTQ